MKNIYLVNLNSDISDFRFFSNTLLRKIDENLKLWKKIILYLNRRWEFSSLLCTSCQRIYNCDNCNVSMKVHEWWVLICHSCWFSKKEPKTCEYCDSQELLKIWIWTQQIENVIKKYFKNINVFRFDTDNIKNIKEKKEALEKLKKADIIIWTKMITTWFDFEWVWLIWVILLEQELTIPEFSTEEKVYSNIKQVIWRWWRKWEETDIVVQTFIPENDLIKSIVEDNYKDFFIKTLKERKSFSYPPFVEYVEVLIKDKSEEKSLKKAEKFYDKLILNNTFDYKVFKIPEYQKRNNIFIYKIWIKWVNISNLLDKVKKDIFVDPNISIDFK